MIYSFKMINPWANPCTPVPLKTLTLTLQNPYPWAGVRVLEGKGKGWNFLPQGYPW